MIYYLEERDKNKKEDFCLLKTLGLCKFSWLLLTHCYEVVDIVDQPIGSCGSRLRAVLCEVWLTASHCPLLASP